MTITQKRLKLWQYLVVITHVLWSFSFSLSTPLNRWLWRILTSRCTKRWSIVTVVPAYDSLLCPTEQIFWHVKKAVRDPPCYNLSWTNTFLFIHRKDSCNFIFIKKNGMSRWIDNRVMHFFHFWVDLKEIYRGLVLLLGCIGFSVLICPFSSLVSHCLTTIFVKS